MTTRELVMLDILKHWQRGDTVTTVLQKLNEGVAAAGATTCHECQLYHDLHTTASNLQLQKPQFDIKGSLCILTSPEKELLESSLGMGNGEPSKKPQGERLHDSVPPPVFDHTPPRRIRTAQRSAQRTIQFHDQTHGQTNNEAHTRDGAKRRHRRM